jgi:hypothetical protein
LRVVIRTCVIKEELVAKGNVLSIRSRWPRGSVRRRRSRAQERRNTAHSHTAPPPTSICAKAVCSKKAEHQRIFWDLRPGHKPDISFGKYKTVIKLLVAATGGCQGTKN